MSDKPRYRIIDLNKFEKENDFELNRTGADAYSQGYQRAIRNIHESILLPDKTLEVLGEVYATGFVVSHTGITKEEHYKKKQDYLNNLIQ